MADRWLPAGELPNPRDFSKLGVDLHVQSTRPEALMAKREIQGLRAIVTGASSGIGREIVRELVQQGARVVATARRQQRLDELVESVDSLKGQIETVGGDLVEPAVRERVIQTARDAFGGLDATINNAGVGAQGFFENADPKRVRRIMEINFFALVEMTRASLPLLKRGNRPILVNISSIFGHRGMPFVSEYSASKFAVQGFSESLRAELAQYPIDVLVVSPGATITEFSDHLIERTEKPPWKNPMPVSAERVAEQTVAAIRRGKQEIVPHTPSRMLFRLNRFSPRLADWIAKRVVRQGLL